MPDRIEILSVGQGPSKKDPTQEKTPQVTRVRGYLLPPFLHSQKDDELQVDLGGSCDCVGLEMSDLIYR